MADNSSEISTQAGSVMQGLLFSASCGESSANRSKEKSQGGNPTKSMHDRWLQANTLLPQVDQKDIFDECPRFNQGKKSCPEHQHHPEYTQTSYLRLRMLEEAYIMKNYME